jgi:hypothetical protein
MRRDIYYSSCHLHVSFVLEKNRMLPFMTLMLQMLVLKGAKISCPWWVRWWSPGKQKLLINFGKKLTRSIFSPAFLKKLTRMKFISYFVWVFFNLRLGLCVIYVNASGGKQIYWSRSCRTGSRCSFCGWGKCMRVLCVK